MSTGGAVGLICALGVVTVCFVTALYSKRAAGAFGTKPWVSYLMVVYGVVFGAVALWVPTIGAFMLGVFVSLLGGNVSQLWMIDVVGPEAFREYTTNLVVRGGRRKWLTMIVVSLMLRGAMGLVLVISSRSDSVAAWLGWGILASIPAALAGAIRVIRARARPRPVQ